MVMHLLSCTSKLGGLLHIVKSSSLFGHVEACWKSLKENPKNHDES